MNGQMEAHFVKKNIRYIDNKIHRPFNICIMDEASQCVEPEAIIPLKLGFTKFIMVSGIFAKFRSNFYNFFCFSGW